MVGVHLWGRCPLMGHALHCWFDDIDSIVKVSLHISRHNQCSNFSLEMKQDADVEMKELQKEIRESTVTSGK